MSSLTIYGVALLCLGSYALGSASLGRIVYRLREDGRKLFNAGLALGSSFMVLGVLTILKGVQHAQ